MAITEYLNNIKNAVLGKDVRDSIHDAIQQCYNDATGNPESISAAVAKIDSLETDGLETTGELKATKFSVGDYIITPMYTQTITNGTVDKFLRNAISAMNLNMSGVFTFLVTLSTGSSNTGSYYYNGIVMYKTMGTDGTGIAGCDIKEEGTHLASVSTNGTLNFTVATNGAKVSAVLIGKY